MNIICDEQLTSKACLSSYLWERSSDLYITIHHTNLTVQFDVKKRNHGALAMGLRFLCIKPSDFNDSNMLNDSNMHIFPNKCPKT